MSDLPKPHFVFARGLWHCVQWPVRGTGLTVRAAWISFRVALRQFS